jgi:hypothetical protein
LADYNAYTEVPCNKVGNKIIVKRPGSNMILAMAGLSILSSCDCSESSFNPALIVAKHPFATAFNTTSTSAKISIDFNKQTPDTVSSVCGLADGFSKCPHITSFKDKETGKPVTFPYRGYDFNATSSVLTLDPAKAAGTCVLIATISLRDYPTIAYSQDIVSTIVGVGFIQNQFLVAVIGEEAILLLPKITGVLYTVTGKPTFTASVDE